MKSRQLVYVEVNPETELPIRILKNHFEASKLSPENVRQMARSVAVGYIRDQIFERTKKGYGHYCEYCGGPITMNFHMHEKVLRSLGGEISLNNSVGLCSRCHVGWDGEHADRQFQSAKIKENDASNS